ncbi:snoRNA-binding rRNA-processing protein utp10 [Zalaria obscura]|uniref:SnoRNA-binding rRNA-processing protein utp10 n=1 Tax=Zalaria obscura TaxID=2024903 RepID=A0ACC3S8K6_9PEZI
MATALQQQLAAIAAKSTHQLDLKAQRTQHSKSLLFESKDAANQTFDTIYQICIEGFDELCMLDARFGPFSQNLFSEQSKGEDRTQMTAKENEELDVVIKSFLGLVGARLLLKPGQKAVEWLIRRFRIHEYNTDWLILTFLPYHTSPMFATMLSILPKTLSPAFKFLHPYVTSLTSPPRPAILYAAINNPGFFSILNQYTIAATKQGFHSAILLGFWASVTAQAINGQIDGAQSGRADVRRQREEDLLLRVVPLLQEALRIKNVPEMFLGSCMIITILVTKTQLEDRVLDGLMEAVTKSLGTQTIDDGLTCLSVIAEERQSAKLPRPVMKALLDLDDVTLRLQGISQSHRVGRLQVGLALSAADELAGHRAVKALDLISATLSSDYLEVAEKTILLQTILPRLENHSEEHTERLQEIIGSIFESTETGDWAQTALERAGIKIEALESQLQIPLRQAEVVDLSAEADVEMTDEPATGSGSLIEDAFTALPESLPSGYSFLETDDATPFTEFAQAFLLVLQSRYGTNQLLDKAVLSSEEALSRPTYFSFLLRLALSKRPATLRNAALRAILKRLQASGESAVDCQGLIPFALVALGDASQAVRKAAADVLVTVKNLYRAGEKAKVPAGINVWASSDLYGKSSKDVKWLESQDAYKVLSTVIVPHLEECVLDADQSSRLISIAMNGAQQHADQKTSDVELKSALRAAFFSFLCSHAVVMPMLDLRNRLLSALRSVGKAGTTGRSQVLLPSLKSWVSLSETDYARACEVYGSDAKELDKHYINNLSARSSDELECLKSLAGGDIGTRLDTAVLAFHRLRQLWQSLKPSTQTIFGQFLLDISLHTTNDAASSTKQAEALEVLRQVDISTEVLSAFLESVPNVAQMQDKPPANKRRRTSKTEASRVSPVDSTQLQSAIRRLTLVLELVEGSKAERHPDLLKGLFHILGELQHYRTQLGSDLVYLQGMVVGCLLAIVDSLKNSPNAKVDRSVLRADLVVECVRSTSSTQVHNTALLLISSLASWAPDLVLHSVMPIFTFMSTTLLRQSDDYSAHVIDRTVSQVVPPLAASLRKSKKDLVTGAAELLLSFTAAFEHVPLHRRLRLFSHLAEALGPDDSLFAIVAMLAEKYPTDNRVPVFSAELMNEFTPSLQLSAAIQYMDLVADAMRPKRTFSETILNFNDKSADQIQDSIAHLLLALAKLLENRSLHAKITKSLKKDEADAESVRTASASLLEKVMTIMKGCSAKPVLNDACGSVLSSSLGLLPTQHFVKSAESLLQRSDDYLRLTVLRSLEQRSQAAKPSDDTVRNAMLAFLPSVTTIISTSTDTALKHSAITCVDHIGEKYGKKDTDAVLSAAQVIIGETALGSSEDSLQIISLLSLATMVEVLRDEIVPLVPKVLERAFSLLEAAVDGTVNNNNAQKLHDAVYALVDALLEYLPWMFSAKIVDRIYSLTYKSAASELISRRGADTRDQFATLASKTIDAKEYLASLDRTSTEAVESGYLAANELLLLLNKVVVNRPKSVLIKHAQALFSILLKTFDFGRLLASNDAVENVELIGALEARKNDIVLEAVLRLNDATFRPFFIRLIEWATSGLPKKDVSGRTHRSVSLFSFLSRFFEQLKSIVTSYSSYILEEASRTLESMSADSDDEKVLLKSILTTLKSSFEHDQDDFWQAPAHFSAVMSPLLSQLTKAKSPAIRETLGVIPAITELAAAAASPEHHKELNTAILKLMRSDDSQVRLAAVKTEQSLTERLGEDWLSLLPEMLPFISELQEDDDEVVERETLVWIRKIEGILGESLEGMLQ